MREKGNELASIEEFWTKSKKGDYESSTALITLTFPHSHQDNLGDLIGDAKSKTGLKGALRLLFQSRGWKSFKDRFNVAGFARAIETNYGANGFHPHYHFVLFFGDRTPLSADQNKSINDKLAPDKQRKKRVKVTPRAFFTGKGSGYEVKNAQLYYEGRVYTQDQINQWADEFIVDIDSLFESDKVPDVVKMRAIKTELDRLWRTSCLAAGLPVPSAKYGVDVSTGCAEYLAKWSAGAELSQAHQKTRSKTLSIYELENKLTDLYKLKTMDNLSDADLKIYLRLKGVMAEYYEVMRGTRFLEWDRAFKEAVDRQIEESIEGLAGDDEDGESMQIVASMSARMYMSLYRRQLLEPVLICMETKGVKAVYDLLVNHAFSGATPLTCVQSAGKKMFIRCNDPTDVAFYLDELREENADMNDVTDKLALARGGIDWAIKPDT
jgi:hypothetical protein